MKRVVFLAISLVGLSISVLAQADPIRNKRTYPELTSTFMRVFGSAYPPYGFVQFCEMLPTQCEATEFSIERFDATPARLSELDAVNRSINKAIQPATDMELYGVSEFWTLPYNGKGDCEDYALLKRHVLVDRGWPASALLLTVVRDEKGEGHAVLTARTAQGDFVLDNKVADVRLWNQTGYRFVMRQSYTNPRSWVSLDPAEAVRSAPLTSMQQSPRR